MHQSFQLTLEDVNFPEGSYDAGKQLYAKQKASVQQPLDPFLKSDGSVDASAMQHNWFPQVSAEVFISHSHADEELALNLAGWLKNTFDIDAFIDSCAWGYSNELLKSIDDKYCYDKNAKFYTYEKRNRSTSHVHAMLTSALCSMIDRTECLMFINTPSSITPKKAVGENYDSFTPSPWIYMELAMSSILPKKSIEAHRGRVKLAKSNLDEMLFLYGLKLDHLAPLNVDHLIKWVKVQEKYSNPLNALYAVVSKKGALLKG